jgi:hypothetical protein
VEKRNRRHTNLRACQPGRKLLGRNAILSNMHFEFTCLARLALDIARSTVGSFAAGGVAAGVAQPGWRKFDEKRSTSVRCPTFGRLSRVAVRAGHARWPIKPTWAVA